MPSSPLPDTMMIESTTRATRSSRAIVPTYNIRILTGTAIHTPTKYLEKHHQNVFRYPLGGDNSTTSSKAAPARPTLFSSPRDTSGNSSACSNPLKSTHVSNCNLLANHNSSDDLSSIDSEGSENLVMAPSLPTFTCFSKHNGPQRHYYAASDLYDAGIWVGFLSPERHRESYRSLPSFSKLRLNAKKFNPPFPPPVSGVAREERHAVCRGCLGDESQLITLREIAYITKTKLVIMPLVNEDDEDLFCILIPQSNDRSLEGVQTYRPYEINRGNQGTSFSNTFMLLTLRNTSQVNGTLETIRTILKPLQTPSSTRLSSPSKEPSVLSRTASADISRRSPLSDEERALAPYEGMQTRRRAARGGIASAQRSPEPYQEAGTVARLSSDDRLRTKSSGSSTLKRKSEAVTEGKEPTKKQHQRAETPASQTQQPTPGSHDASEPPTDANYDTSRSSLPPADQESFITHSPSAVKASPKSASMQPATATPTIISLDLTREQSQRIRLIWTVLVEDVECEFVRGLDECGTFAKLLDLLREDAEQEPQAIDILDDAKTWRLLYQLPGGPRKAFNVRRGNEAAFMRFQDAFAQSSIWSDNPGVRIDVQLEARN